MSRPLVRRTYDCWYRTLLDDANSVPDRADAAILEIGSGGGYAKTVDPSIITSDVVAGSTDMLVDAQKLPFADNSLRAIFLTHSLHHIPDVRLFLREALRTLVSDGVVGIIDIDWTPLARLLFSHDDVEEYYAVEAGAWRLDLKRRADGANQALARIIFERDRKIFETEFPELRIECIEHLPWLGYLCSGGVTRRNVVPTAFSGAVARLDEIARAADGLCSLHCHIRLRRQ
ncbi:MAG TPA: methyltransferase domain-containing protein [Candidatus Baltobacteraceae bacterium]|nr:methyltransferase domain-containing protein [Candidatus Baltobacteraceae bacterium]